MELSERQRNEFVKHAGKSISDLETQLDFLIKELSENYKSVFLSLKSASSVAVASNFVLLQLKDLRIWELPYRAKERPTEQLIIKDL